MEEEITDVNILSDYQQNLDKLFADMKANTLATDYKTIGDNDHAYIRQLGYKINFGSDCSYYVNELSGLSLSSYGDWGTLYPWANDDAKRIFRDMLNKNIIKLWRIR